MPREWIHFVRIFYDFLSDFSQIYSYGTYARITIIFDNDMYFEEKLPTK